MPRKRDQKKIPDEKSSSQQIAEELKKTGKGEIVQVKMLHERAVRKYIMGIEEAHEKAKNSKLFFRESTNAATQ